MLRRGNRSSRSSSRRHHRIANGHPGFEFLESRRMLSAGDPGLIVTENVSGGAGAIAFDVAVQSDGSVVLGGQEFATSKAVITRHTSSGTLDFTYSPDVGTSADIRAIEIDANGKIVAAGTADGTDAFILRLNADGTPDTEFGTNGLWIGPAMGIVADMAIRSTGEIVIAGNSGGAGFVAQVTDPAGLAPATLDSAWGFGGIAPVSFGATMSLEALALQMVGSDERVVVGGWAIVQLSGDLDAAVARFTNDGQNVDTTFGDDIDTVPGNGGVVIQDLGAQENLSGLAVDSQDRILASVTNIEAGVGTMAVYRYEADGTPDMTWDSDGEAQIHIVGSSLQANDIAVDAADQPVVTGFISDTSLRVATARFTASGTPDGSFGSSGALTETSVTGGDFAFGVKIMSDGRIVVGGAAGTDFLAIRYGTTTPPPGPVSIDVNGNLVIEGTGLADNVTVIQDITGLFVTRNGDTFGPFNPTGRILFDGGDGADSITIASSVTLGADITGGAGNDTIIGGSGADVISGGDDSDSVNGGAGQDSLFGDGGTDFLNGDADDDYVDGGAGSDALAGSTGNDIVLGGDGLDVIGGGNGRDILVGGDDSDLLIGNNGDDIIVAGILNMTPIQLQDVRTEWVSAAGYSDRVAGLLAEMTAAAIDDGVIDLLIGGSGSDWFLYNSDGSLATRDIVLDRAPSEIRTDID